MMKGLTASRTRKIALCGILAALTTGLLYLCCMTPLDLTAVMASALITTLCVIEAGSGYAWIFGAVTATLAVLILPDKLYAIEYALFGAAYPILKGYIERLPKIPAFIIKIAMMDLMLLGCLLLAKFVFLAGDDYYSLEFLTMLIGTAMFVLFDFTLTKCISFYVKILRKKLKIK
ncbi:MAG: hypothetical protein IJU57_00780 [Clostridia bacterium]|nr:hypothetical protein [Clostridia bacterium]